jgi:excisionase family DNA binding protein
MADVHKPCPECGETDPALFYSRNTVRCKRHHGAWMVAHRKKPGQREKVREAKNRWLKAHPEVNRANVAAYRARNPKARWTPPAGRVTSSQAAKILGVTRQYIGELIDQGRLAFRRDGRYVLVDRAEVERLLAEQQRDV